jgi:erythromycin esterase
MITGVRRSVWCCVCLTVIVQLGAPVLCSQEAETEQVTKWLTSHAIPLKSVEDTESSADLKPLKQVLRGVRIVGLGEETHGTREFFQLKHRLVAYLVKEAGFTVFAMEVSYAASSAINDYVLNGKGDRNEVLAKQGLWAWDTQEVADLLEWLRQYNAGVPWEKKVRFVGIDIHNNNQGVELVRNYLTKVAPERLEAFNVAAQYFRSDDSGRQHLEYTIQVSAADKAQTFATLNELLGFLYVNESRFTLQTSAAEFRQAFENANVLAEFADTYRRSRSEPNPFNTSGAARDLYMAQNLKRIVNAEKPGTRIILWAHNDHVAKTKGFLGNYLQAAYGPDYYALGFSFNKGSFQSRELSPSVTIGALKEFTVNAAPEGSVEWYLNSTGIKNFIVDFRNTPKTEVIEQWLTKQQRMRSIGLAFVSDRNSYQRVNLQQIFDGLAFIETTTRARPNPTGTRDAWIISEKAKTN